MRPYWVGSVWSGTGTGWAGKRLDVALFLRLLFEQFNEFFEA